MDAPSTPYPLRPGRRQFGLAALMLVTTACAVLAAGYRGVPQVVGPALLAALYTLCRFAAERWFVP